MNKRLIHMNKLLPAYHRLLHLYAVVSAYLRPGMRTIAAFLARAATRAVALVRVARDWLVDLLPAVVRARLGTRRGAMVGLAALMMLGVSLAVSLGSAVSGGGTAAADTGHARTSGNASVAGGPAQPAPTPAPAKPAEVPAPAMPADVTPEQAKNAAAIAEAAAERGLPAKAVTIGLATALQESHLNNIDYGDRDSVGLFQQRPSQGWGTVDEILDPHYAAGKFFDGLEQVPGWQDMRVTDAAQTVQRSAFPEAYEQWVSLATGITHAVTHGHDTHPQVTKPQDSKGHDGKGHDKSQDGKSDNGKGHDKSQDSKSNNGKSQDGKNQDSHK